MRLAWLSGALVLAGAAALARAPGESQAGRPIPSQYEVYGEPVDVTITDLVQNSSAYEGRAVRTVGRLEIEDRRSQRYSLRDNFGSEVLIQPVPEIAGDFDFEVMSLMGQQIEVTGLFGVGGGDFGPAAPGLPRGTIRFWQYIGQEREPKGPMKATEVTLEALVTTPGKRDGQTVRVVGKFRGRNLYGDLPSRSQRSRSDWVIKDDVYAVWVTGKKPKGEGFDLDPGLKRDTGKWLEVVGQIETRAGITYLRAIKVALTTPPTPTAQAQPPPPPPERPKVPPVVVFSLPLDGEADVPPDSRFIVQFSKDMNEESFKGRVVLRYAGPPRPGDRGFAEIKLSYDGGRRALTVDPGDRLRPGRQVELMLLPGIADVDGLALTPRPGKQVEDAVDVLRYGIGT